jgi:glycosyltransferase involved in cell wall biosynthesis
VSTPDVSVVVPVFGNSATLDELIDRQVRVLENLGLSFELIFVDDGSRDGSLALLLERARRDPRIRPFALTRNFGGQSAMCAGFDQVRGKRTVCMDADLENLPEDIPALLAPLDQGFDLVCGVRENRGGSFLMRRLPSLLLNAYVRRQTGTTVRDVGCAMRAMESHLVHDLETEGEKRRLVTPLLLKRAHAVTEVPIRHEPKEAPGGHSFLSLLGIAMDYYLLTARRPFLVSGVLSALAVAAAFVALLFGEGLLGLVLLASGLLGGLLSLVGEYAQRIYQIGQGLPFYQIRRDVSVAEADPSEGEDRS